MSSPTLTATLNTLATAANATYGQTGSPQLSTSQWKPIAINDQNTLNLMAQYNYSGQAWVNTATGELIVASGGTVLPSLANLWFDIQLGTGLTPSSQEAANAFLSAAIAGAEQALLNRTG